VADSLAKAKLDVAMTGLLQYWIPFGSWFVWETADYQATHTYDLQPCKGQTQINNWKKRHRILDNLWTQVD